MERTNTPVLLFPGGPHPLPAGRGKRKENKIKYKKERKTRVTKQYVPPVNLHSYSYLANHSVETTSFYIFFFHFFLAIAHAANAFFFHTYSWTSSYVLWKHTRLKEELIADRCTYCSTKRTDTWQPSRRKRGEFFFSNTLFQSHDKTLVDGTYDDR